MDITEVGHSDLHVYRSHQLMAIFMRQYARMVLVRKLYAFNRWAEHFPLKVKLVEYDRQLKERNYALETVRNAYLRDIVSIKAKLGHLLKLSQKREEVPCLEITDSLAELHAVPSVDLRYLVENLQRHIHQGEENPSSQWQETLIDAGLVDPETNQALQAWEKSRSFRRIQRLKRGPSYAFPDVNAGNVPGSKAGSFDLAKPYAHKLFIRYCRDCVGIMQLVKEWNLEVEAALRFKIEYNTVDAKIEEYKRVVNSLQDAVLVKEADIIRLTKKNDLLEEANHWFEKWSYIKDAQEIERMQKERMQMLAANVQMAQQDKESALINQASRYTQRIQSLEASDREQRRLRKQEQLQRDAEMDSRLRMSEELQHLHAARISMKAEIETLSTTQKQDEQKKDYLQVTIDRLLQEKAASEKVNAKLQKDQVDYLTMSNLKLEELRCQLKEVSDDLAVKVEENDEMRLELRVKKRENASMIVEIEDLKTALEKLQDEETSKGMAKSAYSLARRKKLLRRTFQRWILMIRFLFWYFQRLKAKDYTALGLQGYRLLVSQYQHSLKEEEKKRYHLQNEHEHLAMEWKRTTLAVSFDAQKLEACQALVLQREEEIAHWQKIAEQRLAEIQTLQSERKKLMAELHTLSKAQLTAMTPLLRRAKLYTNLQRNLAVELSQVLHTVRAIVKGLDVETNMQQLTREKSSNQDANLLHQLTQRTVTLKTEKTIMAATGSSRHRSGSPGTMGGGAIGMTRESIGGILIRADEKDSSLPSITEVLRMVKEQQQQAEEEDANEDGKKEPAVNKRPYREIHQVVMIRMQRFLNWMKTNQRLHVLKGLFLHPVKQQGQQPAAAASFAYDDSDYKSWMLGLQINIKYLEDELKQQQSAADGQGQSMQTATNSGILPLSPRAAILQAYCKDYIFIQNLKKQVTHDMRSLDSYIYQLRSRQDDLLAKLQALPPQVIYYLTTIHQPPVKQAIDVSGMLAGMSFLSQTNDGNRSVNSSSEKSRLASMRVNQVKASFVHLLDNKDTTGYLTSIIQALEEARRDHEENWREDLLQALESGEGMQHPRRASNAAAGSSIYQAMSNDSNGGAGLLLEARSRSSSPTNNLPGLVPTTTTSGRRGGSSRRQRGGGSNSSNLSSGGSATRQRSKMKASSRMSSNISAIPPPLLEDVQEESVAALMVAGANTPTVPVQQTRRAINLAASSPAHHNRRDSNAATATAAKRSSVAAASSTTATTTVDSPRQHGSKPQPQQQQPSSSKQAANSTMQHNHSPRTSNAATVNRPRSNTTATGKSSLKAASQQQPHHQQHNNRSNSPKASPRATAAATNKPATSNKEEHSSTSSATSTAATTAPVATSVTNNTEEDLLRHLAKKAAAIWQGDDMVGGGTGGEGKEQVAQPQVKKQAAESEKAAGNISPLLPPHITISQLTMTSPEEALPITSITPTNRAKEEGNSVAAKPIIQQQQPRQADETAQDTTGKAHAEGKEANEDDAQDEDEDEDDDYEEADDEDDDDQQDQHQQEQQEEQALLDDFEIARKEAMTLLEHDQAMHAQLQAAYQEQSLLRDDLFTSKKQLSDARREQADLKADLELLSADYAQRQQENGLLRELIEDSYRHSSQEVDEALQAFNSFRRQREEERLKAMQDRYQGLYGGKDKKRDQGTQIACSVCGIREYGLTDDLPATADGHGHGQQHTKMIAISSGQIHEQDTIPEVHATLAKAFGQEVVLIPSKLKNNKAARIVANNQQVVQTTNRLRQGHMTAYEEQKQQQQQVEEYTRDRIVTVTSSPSPTTYLGYQQQQQPPPEQTPTADTHAANNNRKEKEHVPPLLFTPAATAILRPPHSKQHSNNKQHVNLDKQHLDKQQQQQELQQHLHQLARAEQRVEANSQQMLDYARSLMKRPVSGQQHQLGSTAAAAATSAVNRPDSGGEQSQQQSKFRKIRQIPANSASSLPIPYLQASVSEKTLAKIMHEDGKLISHTAAYLQQQKEGKQQQQLIQQIEQQQQQQQGQQQAANKKPRAYSANSARVDRSSPVSGSRLQSGGGRPPALNIARSNSAANDNNNGSYEQSYITYNEDSLFSELHVDVTIPSARRNSQQLQHGGIAAAAAASKYVKQTTMDDNEDSDDGAVDYLY